MLDETLLVRFEWDFMVYSLRMAPREAWRSLKLSFSIVFKLFFEGEEAGGGTEMKKK